MDKKYEYIDNRLDLLEFKQNIIILKPPHHSTQLFYDLTLEDFLKIRNFVNEFSIKMRNDESLSLDIFEKRLVEIWQPIKSYPLSATLIAKVLMEKDLYQKLFS